MAYLGLDLGTAFAVLARMPGEGRPAPGEVPEVVTVPTAVAYRDGRAEIPDGPGAPTRETIRCDGFPALLAAALGHSQVAAWQERTAAQVTLDFLRCLLALTGGGRAPTRPDHGDEDGEPPGIVIAVPPRDRSAHGPVESHGASEPHSTGEPPGSGGDDRAGEGIGEEISSALRQLGWQPKRLVAAPVAALLWLRHQDPERAAAGKVLVVDAGAGSVDFSLCDVTGTAIRLADSARLVAGTAWMTGGSAADETASGQRTLVEDLVAALAAGSRQPRTQQQQALLWRALEAELADGGVQGRLDVVLQQAEALPARHRGAPALRFGGLDVTAGEFLAALEPLIRRSVSILAELLGRQDDPGWRRFGGPAGPRVVLLGGLTALWPLRAALLSALGLDPGQPDDSVLLPDGGGRTSAVARGAALLAAGLADPGDHYPHGLRLIVRRVVRDRLVTEYLPLAAPGSIDLERTSVSYLTQPGGAGEPLSITVPPEPPASTGGHAVASWPIPVEVVPAAGAPVGASFRPAVSPVPGVYWIGVRGGPDGPAVVLKPATGGEPVSYPLAALADTRPDRASAPRGSAQRPEVSL
jgi:hypothetical protein